MRYNRCASPTDFPIVSCNNSASQTNTRNFIMSVPECERYRNSTMFVGSPPFGYEGTDDRTSNNDSTWHPPRTPPHSMVYREHICPHPGPCQDTFIRSRSPAKFSSTEADVPDMKLVDVVPALFSSPKLKSHMVEDSGYFPDLSRLSIHDNEQSRRPANDLLSTLDGKLRDTAKHAPIATANTNNPDDGSGDGVDLLRLLPELMSDEEHDDNNGLATAGQSASPKSSNGGESPHMHDFLRCPECQHVLKWVFVEHTTAKGEHHVHRCQARCTTCETSGDLSQARKMDEFSGEMVQVGRGAW
jgi:hypothetical protein